jgi:hypothetical protein
LPTLLKVTEQRREGLVGRWQQSVLEMRKRVAVGIPGLIVSQVDLDQRHT